MARIFADLRGFPSEGVAAGRGRKSAKIRVIRDAIIPTGGKAELNS